jgi:3-hydroxybutyryl-CoA dehydratase
MASNVGFILGARGKKSALPGGSAMFGGLSLGMTHSISKTISESDVYLFGGIVGDLHPNHVNAVYAEKHLGGRVAHGALLTGFVSRCAVELIGTKLDETGYAAQQFTIKCLAPVFIGNTITVRVTVKDLNIERRKVELDAEIHRHDGVLCAIGSKTIKVLRKHDANPV